MSEAKKKILIVDDERIYIDVLVELLQPDYKVIVAKNGEQALRRAAEAPVPDLILLDWLMPGMDGLEVCKKLRESSITREIPVIFLTVKSEVEDEIMGLGCGAVDYIRKPLSPPIVKARVSTQMALCQARSDLRAYNDQLQIKVDESTAELRLRNETLGLLNQMSEHLQQTQDVEVIARETVSALISISNPPRVGIFLLDQQGQTLELIAQHGFDQAMTSLGAKLPVEGSLLGKAIARRELMQIKDIEQAEVILPKMQTALLADGIRCAVLVPILYQDNVLGIIGLGYRHAEDSAHIDNETYTAIGRSVALAISNARHVSELEHRTLHDDLTGLPNRAMLHRQCAHMIKQHTNGGGRLALLLFDIDRFKDINDTLGHEFGDNLLKTISARILSGVVADNMLFCRLGGDEFALVWQITDGLADAMSTAQQLTQVLSEPFPMGEMALGIRASIGLALYPEHATDSSGLLRCADIAMYQAKRTSSSIEVYDQQLDQHSPERLAMIVGLDAAIRENQLLLHYQPKVSLKDRRLIGYEALVRWQHPQQGLVAPADFIPLAEMSDQIHLLTYWVVDHAIAQLKVWSEQGLDVSIAINLSTRNLLDQNCAAKLESLINKYGVDARRVELEITESALMHDPERAQTSLEQIAALGVQLSIDDFGTGYSSLAYLRRLPVTTLKIDRSFVSDMTDNQQDMLIVRSTIGLAHSLGLKVIAEGVEDRETLSTLHDLECDFAQGFYISAPLEAGSALEWNGEQAI